MSKEIKEHLDIMEDILHEMRKVLTKMTDDQEQMIENEGDE